MFKGKKGQERAQDIGKRSKTFVPGEKLVEKTGPSKEDVELIKVIQSIFILFVLLHVPPCYFNAYVGYYGHFLPHD